MNHAAARWLSCVFSLMLISCSSSKRVLLPGEGPIAQFARDGHWLYVYAARNASRSDLIRIGAFVPFQPGVSARDAVDRFGAPQRVIPPEHGAEYVEYSTSQGRFRLGSEESADGYIGYPLYFFPNDRRPASLFSAHVLAHLRLTTDKEVVMLFECGYAQPFMHATIESGQIENVVWVSDRELRRRSSPEQCIE
jgi:hypothetical protein